MICFCQPVIIINQSPDFFFQHWSLNWSISSVRMKMVHLFTIVSQMDHGTATMVTATILMETMNV